MKLADGRELKVDESIAFCIHVLNDAGIQTLGSCSGHLKYKPSIIIKRNGSIFELMSGKKIPRDKEFYEKDGDGDFFIPETKILIKNSGVQKS